MDYPMQPFQMFRDGMACSVRRTKIKSGPSSTKKLPIREMACRTKTLASLNRSSTRADGMSMRLEDFDIDERPNDPN